MTAQVLIDTRHFNYKTAAVELAIPERWLRTHIKTLPHRKFGRYIRFSVPDLIAISERYAISVQAENADASEPAPASAMPDIRPSSNRHASNR